MAPTGVMGSGGNWTERRRRLNVDPVTDWENISRTSSPQSMAMESPQGALGGTVPICGSGEQEQWWRLQRDQDRQAFEMQIYHMWEERRLKDEEAREHDKQTRERYEQMSQELKRMWAELEVMWYTWGEQANSVPPAQAREVDQGLEGVVVIGDRDSPCPKRGVQSPEVLESMLTDIPTLNRNQLGQCCSQGAPESGESESGRVQLWTSARNASVEYDMFDEMEKGSLAQGVPSSSWGYTVFMVEEVESLVVPCPQSSLSPVQTESVVMSSVDMGSDWEVCPWDPPQETPVDMTTNSHDLVLPGGGVPVSLAKYEWVLWKGAGMVNMARREFWVWCSDSTVSAWFMQSICATPDLVPRIWKILKTRLAQCYAQKRVESGQERKEGFEPRFSFPAVKSGPLPDGGDRKQGDEEAPPTALRSLDNPWTWTSDPGLSQMMPHHPMNLELFLLAGSVGGGGHKGAEAPSPKTVNSFLFFVVV